MQHLTSHAHAPSHQLSAARYVSLTTFTGSGEKKSTPVWPVDAGDGQIGFITSTTTWKVTRIRHDGRVIVQPSDARGRVLEHRLAVTGTAVVVTGEAFDSLRRAVRAKYGYQLRIIDLLHALPGRRTGHRNDCAVVITLDPS